MCKLGAVTISNRIATVTENGLEHEADQRHAVILMRDMGLDEGRSGAVTPGVSATEGGQVGEAFVGGGSLSRAVAARGNYVWQDRMDAIRSHGDP